MRIIAGEYRRRTLRTPPGVATRPTSDRLRETLFNVLASRIEGARFLDLYAGSGAIGIEALSRGADHATFVEQAPAAVAAIRANLTGLGVAGPRYTLETRPVTSWLRRAATPQLDPAPFHLVFLDPPYEDQHAYAEALTLLGQQAGKLLAPAALVVAEHRRARRSGDSIPLANRYAHLERVRLLEQGDAALSFYSLAPQSASDPVPL